MGNTPRKMDREQTWCTMATCDVPSLLTLSPGESRQVGFTSEEFPSLCLTIKSMTQFGNIIKMFES